ncbi:MAG: DUF433 domain-containing protein [Planctomycetes bacterium]|nr:DUF433 domain-containing protein [Planctomycetota bacterium]
MPLHLEAQPLPLKAGDDGVIRIGATRVTLDTILAAFREGATAEEIAQQYSSVPLADVYSAISFYLRQRERVDEYLRDRERRGEEVRALNEGRFDPQGVRDRLVARRAGSA